MQINVTITNSDHWYLVRRITHHLPSGHPHFDIDFMTLFSDWTLARGRSQPPGSSRRAFHRLTSDSHPIFMSRPDHFWGMNEEDPQTIWLCNNH